MYGVTKQAVQQWILAGGFPEPIYCKPKQLVWHTADVAAWAKRTGRTVKSGPD